jgi:hypothetical protein
MGKPLLGIPHLSWAKLLFKKEGTLKLFFGNLPKVSIL